MILIVCIYKTNKNVYEKRKRKKAEDKQIEYSQTKHVYIPAERLDFKLV